MLGFLLFAVLFAVALMAAAGRDLSHAADPEYDSLVGIDKPRGWAATIVAIVLALVVWGIAGCGPLAALGF